MKNIKKTRKIIIEIIVYAIVGVILAYSIYADRTEYNIQLEEIKNTSGNPPVVGRPSPEFSLTDAETGEVTDSAEIFDSQKGNTLMIFSFPSCPHIKTIMDEILLYPNQSEVQYDNIYIIFYSIENESDSKVVDNYISLYPEFNIYTEVGNTVKWGFKFKSAPSSYTFDKEGIITYRSFGAFTENSKAGEENKMTKIINKMNQN